MQAEAIAKLKSEVAASNNPAVQAIGQFLLQHLDENPDDAGSILKNDKTITKSLEAMRKVAEKKKVGNMAVLSDSEGFAIVLKYFKTEEPAAPAAPAAKPAEKKKDTKPEPAKAAEPDDESAAETDEDDFDFDSLLE